MIRRPRHNAEDAEEVERILAKALRRMDELGYPAADRVTAPIDDRPAEGEEVTTPDSRQPRSRGGLRLARAAVATLALSACTPLQLAVLEQETGRSFDEPTTAALLGAPDAPMPVGDGRVILADGTLTWLRVGYCDQWRGVALAAGWTGPEFDGWASRIIYRESRCNASAISRTNDSGLFQINRVVLADMAQRPGLWAEAIDKLGGVPSQSGLLDPMTNAIVAETLFDIRGRAPWS